MGTEELILQESATSLEPPTKSPFLHSSRRPWEPRSKNRLQVLQGAAALDDNLHGNRGAHLQESATSLEPPTADLSKAARVSLNPGANPWIGCPLLECHDGSGLFPFQPLLCRRLVPFRPHGRRWQGWFLITSGDGFAPDVACNQNSASVLDCPTDYLHRNGSSKLEPYSALISPISGIPAAGIAPATVPESSVFQQRIRAAPPKHPATTANPHLQPWVSWAPAQQMPSIGSAPATSPPEILIGNVPLKPCADLYVSEDKIATAFHNSSRKTLTYIPPSVQNGEVLVRPTIDMIREGSNRWNTTAVGYFLGKRPYFHHLNEFVRSIWPAVQDVKATSNGFFFFQFKTMAAMEEVLEGGPWLYLGQPIVLQKWEPGMVLRKLKHTEVPVWIKLRHLPVELWTTDGLSTVASGIGKPLYPDAITRACTRLDFARVCVMLNVNSKLPKHIVIMMPNEHGGESPCKVDVEYEWLPPKCTNCTSLGHASKECPLTKPVKPAVSIYVRENQIPAPASRTGDPIPAPDPVLDHPVAKDDMATNERPHLKTDNAPRMFPHVEHNDLECSGPKQEGSSGRRARPCLRIQMAWFVDYSGPGNRIWIAWNDDFIDVDILNIGAQFIHCRVLMHDMHEPILLTVVYGANEVIARRELWQGLTELAMSVDLPWLVYLKATQLEHVMLRQRAKLQWLKGGDQCSKVFFRRVATRRANKRLFQISDSDGLVQTDPNIISSVFVSYFQDLLGGDRAERAIDLHYLRPWARHILTEEEAYALIRPVTVDDVKTAMFDIEEDKAPGPDGFSSGFYKAAWPIVGEEISKAIMDFFTTGRLLKQVNATVLTLIPKVRTPHSVSDFRPISCCNVIYKVISKILVCRFREILDLLISPSQNAFVPGRLISDNVLLAQELFSGYNQCRLPPRCALKVDLRKAYDTVEWDFLFATLRLFGFPAVFIRWIEECVTSAHYSVVVNGGVHGFFAGARGLRQGDPMSPYLCPGHGSPADDLAAVY
ncbi:UNVERIFIED_CONTAM: Retrovirus-related Pol polyprotein from type-2 retrotransposable element R2DM [Sesamum angustifolium]|uniref:Retrovirus-related Pol polyprotein from type-2 retrotransposable element R2DM n=1 Tax=Sesamum angustifolium TaxID=2727405 RepID=A0AAW2J5N7_9LAMI